MDRDNKKDLITIKLFEEMTLARVEMEEKDLPGV